jgi:hypothetical protein
LGDGEPELALLLNIAMINMFSRLNVKTPQVAGECSSRRSGSRAERPCERAIRQRSCRRFFISRKLILFRRIFQELSFDRDVIWGL